MRRKTAVPALMAVLLAGCIQAPESAEDVPELADWSTEELALASYPDETEDKQYSYVPVPASFRGWACEAACSLIVQAGCIQVGLACTGASVLTLGQFTIPCAWAIWVACGAGIVAATGCSRICPE